MKKTKIVMEDDKEKYRLIQKIKFNRFLKICYGPIDVHDIPTFDVDSNKYEMIGFENGFKKYRCKETEDIILINQ